MNPVESLAIISVALIGGALLFPLFRGLGRRLERGATGSRGPTA